MNKIKATYEKDSAKIVQTGGIKGHKKEMLLGSEAIAYAVKLCKPDIIAAYPITPQTHIIETLSDMVDSGQIKGQYIKVESEMTAIAACYGAVAAGSRAFTATSSHGLAFMHEMLHWFSGSRFPFVLVNANRALGGPWCIWTDQSDSMSQRDTGFMQFYCETVQESLDTVIQSYYISEKLMLPVMVMIDGFILSHTMEPLFIPHQNLVDTFLPPYKAPYKLDTDNPLNFGGATKGDSFYNLRKMLNKTMESAFEIISDCDKLFCRTFGRSYGNVETYRVEDADTVIITCGAITGTVRIAVDMLRNDGQKVGLIKLRLFRPFPKIELMKALSKTKDLIVLNRSISYGTSGTITQEIRSAMYNINLRPSIYDVIVSLGGKEVYPETIIDIVSNKENLTCEDVNWL